MCAHKEQTSNHLVYKDSTKVYLAIWPCCFTSSMSVTILKTSRENWSIWPCLNFLLFFHYLLCRQNFLQREAFRASGSSRCKYFQAVATGWQTFHCIHNRVLQLREVSTAVWNNLCQRHDNLGEIDGISRLSVVSCFNSRLSKLDTFRPQKP